MHSHHIAFPIYQVPFNEVLSTVSTPFMGRIVPGNVIIRPSGLFEGSDVKGLPKGSGKDSLSPMKTETPLAAKKMALFQRASDPHDALHATPPKVVSSSAPSFLCLACSSRMRY